MAIEENKSRVWYKVLAMDGGAIDGSGEQWSLPKGTYKGAPAHFVSHTPRWHANGRWFEIRGMHGTWLVSDPLKAYTPNSGQRLFIAELMSPPLEEAPGVVWAGTARLVREATRLDFRRHGIHRAFGQKT